MPLQSEDFFVHRYRFWKKRFRNWISAQPRISAHLELAPILKAEKVNKRPPPTPHPHPLLLPIKFKYRKGLPPPHPCEWQWDYNWNWISNNIYNKRLPRGRRLLRSILQKPCFVTSSRFVIAFVVLLQNKHTTLAENGEKLISVQPRISAHLE